MNPFKKTFKFFPDYWTFFFDLVSGKRQRSEIAAADKRERDIEGLVPQNTSLRILDLGNGRLRPQFEILRKRGHIVDGIDFVNRPFSLSFEEAAYFFARMLFNIRIPGVPSARSKLFHGDVSFLPFQDGTYDLITSAAAFEHFLDVPKVVSEAHRVLKDGGVIWCLIHPFTALSGGHNISLQLDALESLPAGIEPWDHLRKRKIPFHVPLNELRIGEYLAIFAKHFEILKHYVAGREGKKVLEEMGEEPELAEYSFDELTTACYVIVGRKKVPSTGL